MSDKRANCAALELVVEAAKKHVKHVEHIDSLHGEIDNSEEWSQLGTSIFMMERYIKKHELS